MDWASHTALVVEDSAVQRAYLVGLLEELGLGAVLEADDGRQALRVLDAHAAPAVGLVLTDLEMPVMDGIELIRHLAERGVPQHLIVVSARDPRLFEIVERMAPEAGELRLLGTLAKPFGKAELATLLGRAGIDRRRAIRAGTAPALGLHDIERAIGAREFVPYFQPKVSLSSGALNGVEALARWHHSEYGILAPDQFIPLIEGTRLMAPFTLQIVEQTLQELALLGRHGMASMAVSINLSGDILADRTFIERLAALVDSFDVPHQQLIWEVTETMLMTNVAEALANLARLGLKGFGLAMDDYGVGYSSIEQFSRCPFTELKIDRNFVRDAARRPTRCAILESAIAMGHRLNVATVAEGVETSADWQLLRTLGCDFAQGYLIGKPMPAGELPHWIGTGHQLFRSLCAEARP